MRVSRAGQGDGDALGDVALVRAAARHDGAAFGQLFDRFLGPVFEAAWHVLADREAAAEIARDTFADAWSELRSLPPETFRPWVLDRARARASDWMAVHAPHRHVPPSVVSAPVEPVGPVLRARIVAALEAQGVQTRAVAKQGWWRSRRPVGSTAGYTTKPPAPAATPPPDAAFPAARPAPPAGPAVPPPAGPPARKVEPPAPAAGPSARKVGPPAPAAGPSVGKVGPTGPPAGPSTPVPAAGPPTRPDERPIPPAGSPVPPIWPSTPPVGSLIPPAGSPVPSVGPPASMVGPSPPAGRQASKAGSPGMPGSPVGPPTPTFGPPTPPDGAPTAEVGRSAPDPRPTPERTTVASVPALGPVGPAAAASSPLEGARRRLGDLLDTDGGRIGATAVVVLLIVLAIAGSLAFTGEGGEPDDAVAADDAPDPTVPVTSTTTSTTSTTTSTTTTSTTTTTAPPTTTTEPPPPPTTAAPAPPPPPPTTEPPPAPDIESFWGNYWGREGSGNCRRYERPLTLWWNADDATGARIRPEGGDWQEVSIGLGSHSTCSDYGTTWVLEVSNDAGVTDTATWR